MNGVKQWLYLFGLALIAAMVVLSIYGACIGSEKAAVFFNSIPLILFWALLAVVLIGGMFAGLRRNLFLFLMHAGCLLVLAGGGLEFSVGPEHKKRCIPQAGIFKGAAQNLSATGRQRRLFDGR